MLSVDKVESEPRIQLAEALSTQFENVDGIFRRKTAQGYWSNISKNAQDDLLDALERTDVQEAIDTHIPTYQNFIYAPIRSEGLKLLDIQENHVGIDYGCMWGNLLLAAAEKAQAMVGVDITEEHLQFLKHRLREEGTENVLLVNHDLKEAFDLSDRFDFSIVNGVLEWVPFDPEAPATTDADYDPRQVQLQFLRTVCQNLKQNGTLYLAIENRYDYQYFLWKPDVHTRQMYTAFLPRSLADIISRWTTGQPYMNYIYSHRQLEQLLREAGFTQIEKYSAFPSYRYPGCILPIDKRQRDRFTTYYHCAPTKNPLKRLFRGLRRRLDGLIFKKLGLMELAPAFIFIAKK